MAVPDPMLHSAKNLSGGSRMEGRFYDAAALMPFKDIFSIIFLAALWALLVLLVNPVGDFPINDDWAYAWSVRSVHEEGRFLLSGWTAANLFTQIYWGALFAKIFGFSFNVLRASTLVLGLFGVIGTYALFRILSQGPRLSLMAALLVALNPIYFSLSYSFMNDVPSFAFCILALCLMARGLIKGSRLCLILGTALSLFAILSRQSCLAIPMALTLSLLLCRPRKMSELLWALMPAMAGVFVQLSYQYWLKHTGRVPEALFGMQANRFFNTSLNEPFRLVTGIGTLSLVALIYVGVFVFPFLVLLFPRLIREGKRRSLKFIGCFAALAAVFAAALLWRQKRMPLSPGICFDFGCGALGLKGIVPPLSTGLSALWLGVTVLGVLGAVVLILCALKFVRLMRCDFKTYRSDVLILGSAFIYCVPLSVIGFYDRYLLFLLPAALLVIRRSFPDEVREPFTVRSWRIATGLLFLLGAVSVATTHDYLAMNRARWIALNSLMNERRIPPNRIEGGFEFYGLYLYDSKSGKRTTSDNNDFVVSFSELPDYRVAQSVSYKKWLPPGEGKIYVLEK